MNRTTFIDWLKQSRTGQAVIKMTATSIRRDRQKQRILTTGYNGACRY